MTNLLDVWQQVENLLSQGLSLIPVRDKPQIFGGKEYPAKTPFRGWKEYQRRQILVPELWHQMNEQYDTTAVAIIGGAISGNLEIIDIDVKNWPGIDAKLFSDLELLYPDLRRRLRIHKSPSGGYHILYKVTGGQIPGNKKLARKEGQKEAAIETRGEGGYVLAPPSLGYSAFQDVPIPSITWEERCSIISICEGYNEVIKVEKPFNPSKTEQNYYSTNPFEDFNNSPNGERVLVDSGWKEEGRNTRFIWFTRPGKDRGVSASFNIAKRIFYIFTSSTEFEPDRGYQPSTALSILQHGGDRKKTFQHLVSSGYGRVNPTVEKKTAASLARRGDDLPANFSMDARQLHADTQLHLTELHPYGVFWKYNDEDQPYISREKLYNVAFAMGFRYYKANLVRIDGWKIHRIDEREFQDILKAYIKEPEPDRYEEITDAFEAFMQRNGTFTMSRLPHLETEKILNDTANICYKFFRNGFLSIDSKAITFLEYDSFDMLVWSDKVQPRDYNKTSGGLYVDFLEKATNYPALSGHVQRVIGFLSHEYKDETTGFIVVLTEQCPDPKLGGGSGKNVFCNLLSHTTTYTSKPGVQAKMDEKFFQSWNGQRLFGISDVPKNFDFSFLKEPSTGSFIWKKLFKDEIEVSNEDAPKFIVQTNFSYEISDGGLKRRIIPIEFTDFFTKSGGLDVHYGVHFPKGWTAKDWGGFDTFIAECVQAWLIAGRKLSAVPLTETGWEKQWEHTHGSIAAQFVRENFTTWVDIGFISNEDFKTQLEKFYNENSIQHHYRPSSMRINKAVEDWAAKHDVLYQKDQIKRDGYITIKVRTFTDMTKTPF